MFKVSLEVGWGQCSATHVKSQHAGYSARARISCTCMTSTRAHAFRTRRCRALDEGAKEQKITGQAYPYWLESLEQAILSLIAAA